MTQPAAAPPLNISSPRRRCPTPAHAHARGPSCVRSLSLLSRSQLALLARAEDAGLFADQCATQRSCVHKCLHFPISIYHYFYLFHSSSPPFQRSSYSNRKKSLLTLPTMNVIPLKGLTGTTMPLTPFDPIHLRKHHQPLKHWSFLNIRTYSKSMRRCKALVTCTYLLTGHCRSAPLQQRSNPMR